MQGLAFPLYARSERPRGLDGCEACGAWWPGGGDSCRDRPASIPAVVIE